MSKFYETAGDPVAASSSVTQSDSDSGNGTATVEAPADWPLRVRVALVAAWEIDALTAMVMAAQGDQTDRAVHFVLRRLRQLSGAVMGALGDACDDAESIRERVFPDQIADFANVAA